MKKTILLSFIFFCHLSTQGLAANFSLEQASCRYLIPLTCYNGPGDYSEIFVDAGSSRKKNNSCLDDLEAVSTVGSNLDKIISRPSCHTHYDLKGILIYDSDVYGKKTKPFESKISSGDLVIVSHDLNLYDYYKDLTTSSSKELKLTLDVDTGNVQVIKKEVKEFSDGNYSGSLVNGKRTGPGELELRNGIKVSGKWKNNQPDGLMRLLFTSGDVIVGELKNFKVNGKGVILYKNGSSYKGDIVNNKRYGLGKFVFQSKILEGRWFADEYVESKNETKKLPDFLLANGYLVALNPTNDGSENCELSLNQFKKCEYSESGELINGIFKDKLDVNFLFSITQTEVSVSQSYGSSLLENLVNSGRYSIDQKTNSSDISLLKVILGRYTLFSESGSVCDNDGCLDEENFDIAMVERAASQCSLTLIDLLEARGFRLKSDFDYIDPAGAAEQKAQEYDPDSLEYKVCMGLVERLKN